MFIKTPNVNNHHHGTILWNSLCNAVRLSCAKTTFKKRLKAFQLIVMILSSLSLLFIIIIVIIIYQFIIFQFFAEL